MSIENNEQLSVAEAVLEGVIHIHCLSSAYYIIGTSDPFLTNLLHSAVSYCVQWQ
jgi:hypothetical protein